MCLKSKITRIAELGEDCLRLSQAEVLNTIRLDTLTDRLEVLADHCCIGDFTVYGNVHSGWVLCTEALALAQNGSAPLRVVQALLTTAAWRLQEALRAAERTQWARGAGRVA